MPEPTMPDHKPTSLTAAITKTMNEQRSHPTTMNTHVNRHHYEEWVVDTLKELKDGTCHLAQVPLAMLNQRPDAHRWPPKLFLDYDDFTQGYSEMLDLAAKADTHEWQLHQQAVTYHNEHWQTHGAAAYEAIRASDEAALSQQVAGL